VSEGQANQRELTEDTPVGTITRCGRIGLRTLLLRLGEGGDALICCSARRCLHKQAPGFPGRRRGAP